VTAVEVFVIVFGLYLGYWIVAKLIGGNGKPTSKNDARVEDDRSAASSVADLPWHDVLEVSRNVSVDELRAAYQAQISRYHPDKVATMGQEIREVAERRSKAINAAYRQALRERGLA
jgi:hypothetical protein